MSELNKSKDKRTKEKRVLDKYISPFANFFIKYKFTPNILSFLGFLCTIGAAFFIAIGVLHDFRFGWTVPVLLGFAGSFDVLDGEVARRTGNLTKTGAFLDSNLDRISDAILILALIFSGFINFIVGYIIMFLIIMISYIRARSEKEGVSMKGVGIMERAERIVILMIALNVETWIYYFSGLRSGTPWVIFNPIITGKAPVTWFFLFFILVFMALLIVTIGQRIIYTFKSLSKLDAQKE